jgi:6,7-dimethyl-8-ribityllumazine synthase
MAEASELTLDEAQSRAVAEANWAICVATFYRDLADRLIDGARSAYVELGAKPESISVFEVPGAFELPLAARYCADSGRFAGAACLGVVIRGETDHYDFVCAEAASGLNAVQLESRMPATFGVITCNNREQAEARAGGGKRDHGRNAAVAAVRMYLLEHELTGAQR